MENSNFLDYNNEQASTIEFKNLKILHTWGGYLQRNIIMNLGIQLLELKLVHVEQITLSGAISDICNYCINLTKLELQNCSLKELIHDHECVKRNSNHKLKHLVLVSKCSEYFMNKIFKIFVNLEFLECGTSTGISDQVVESNVLYLKKLKFFKIAHSKALTISSIHILLDNCSNLQEISDLSSFPNITKTQIQELQKYLTTSNIDVRLG